MNSNLAALLLCMTLSLPAFAREGGISSGSNGDARSIYLEEGKDLAVQILQNLTPASLEEIKDKDAVAFLLTRAQALASDLQDTRLSWDGDERGQPACAQTDLSSSAMILLSYLNCQGIYSKEHAAKLVLHEGVHHLQGSASRTGPATAEEEEFANRVAIAAFAGWESLKLKTTPLCEEPSNMIASGLFGDWKIEERLSTRLQGRIDNDVIVAVSLVRDVSVLKELPPLGTCALVAGRMSITVLNNGALNTDTGPFVLYVSRGNTMIEAFRRVNTGLHSELHHVMLAKARKAESDILILGFDTINEATQAFVRK